jgi:HEAT repeat protein
MRGRLDLVASTATTGSSEPVTIASAFGIAPHMRLAVGLAVAQRGLLGAARALILVTGMALLVATVGVKLLPALYMATGAVMLLLAPLLQLLSRHLQPARSLVVVLAPLALLVGAAWTAGGSVPAWSVLSLALAGLLLWLLPEPHRFAPETRPGEPLLQLLAAADLAAFSLVALVLPALLQLIKLNDLVMVGAVTLMLALLLLSLPAVSLAQVTMARPRIRLRSQTGGQRYALLLLGLICLSMTVFFAVDFTLLSAVDLRFSEPSEIASFLASLLGAASLISLAGSSASGWLLRHLGAPGLLQSVPSTVGSVAAAAMLTLVLSERASVLFWLLVALKLIDLILRETIGRATLPVLLQPLSSDLRAGTNLLVHWLAPALAALLCGAVLLLVAGTVSIWESFLLAIILLTAALWVGLTLPLRKAYQQALDKALERRRLEGVLSSWFREETALSTVRQGLASERPAEAIYCLDLLRELDDSQVDLCLPGLLRHPSAEARREVLLRLRGEAAARVSAEIRLLLEEDPSPDVRGAAAQLVCASGELASVEDVAPLLTSSERQLRVGALRGLLQSREIEPLMIANEELNRLVGSDDWQDRLLAAEVLVEAEEKESRRQLLALLGDQAPRVRQAALQASLLTSSPRLWPAVIDNLDSTESAWAAAARLVNVGSPVVDALIATFESSTSRDVRRRTLSVLERIGGDKVASFFWKLLPTCECEGRHRVLTALANDGDFGERNLSSLSEMIQSELAAAAWNLTVLLELSEPNGVEVLVSALRREVARSRDRISLLIRLLATGASTIKSLRSRTAGNLLELAPNLVGPVIEAFLEAQEPEEQLAQLAEHFPVEPMGYEERLIAIVERSEKLITTWSRACALYLMADADISRVRDVVVKSLSNREPLIRETAIWVLVKLDPDGVQVHLDRARKDRAFIVAEMAEHLAARRQLSER